MSTELLCNDEWLLKRIAEGDESSFRIIFDRYKTRFYATAVKMTRSADEAEEIVQEVFVNLWLRRRVLANVENPSGYLFTILYNKIYAHFKKLAAERQMMIKLGERTPESRCSVEEEFYLKETNRLLNELVGRLPPRQKQIYVLSKQEGLSRDEIAKRLQISPHTVKNHLQEAVKFIRLHLYKAMILFFYFSV